MQLFCVTEQHYVLRFFTRLSSMHKKLNGHDEPFLKHGTTTVNVEDNDIFFLLEMVVAI